MNSYATAASSANSIASTSAFSANSIVVNQSSNMNELLNANRFAMPITNAWSTNIISHTDKCIPNLVFKSDEWTCLRRSKYRRINL